jgi:hypothetical protein
VHQRRAHVPRAQAREPAGTNASRQGCIFQNAVGSSLDVIPAACRPPAKVDDKIIDLPARASFPNIWRSPPVSLNSNGRGYSFIAFLLVFIFVGQCGRSQNNNGRGPRVVIAYLERSMQHPRTRFIIRSGNWLAILCVFLISHDRIFTKGQRFFLLANRSCATHCSRANAAAATTAAPQLRCGTQKRNTFKKSTS